MTNDDLKRFYPVNSNTDKPNTFVRYDNNGNLPGSSGEGGVGVDSIDKLNLSIGESSGLYDTDDGITITGQAQIEAGGRQYDVEIKQNIPVVAGKGVIIDASEDGKYIEIKTSQLLTPLTLQGTNLLTSTETFNKHVQILVEFETDSIHAGFDCILHPYVEAICFETYDELVNGQANFGQAYLNENGQVIINVPNGLTFTNIHAHYIEVE